MKSLMVSIVALFVLICISTMTSCTYVRQGEKAFFYNVSSGKPVDSTNNPILAMGFNSAFGWNQKVFSVQGTIMDYEFTSSTNGSSPYNEEIDWNTVEGVVMATEYKLYGHVSDPWVFFLHFEEAEYDYKIASGKDIRVYEALRQSGRYFDQLLNSYASTNSAEAIRTRPDILKQLLLPKVREYMQEFGFEITDLMFMGNFRYPGGNIIQEARQQITDLDSQIRGMAQACSNKVNQTKIDIEQAKIDARRVISEAMRRASAMNAESLALATALRQSIDQIGIEGTMALKITELYGKLTAGKAIPLVIVNEDSIFAAPFYRVSAATNGSSLPKKIALLPVAE